MKKEPILHHTAYRINYVYFGFLFLFLASLHVFHICFIDVGSLSTKIYFIVDALTQCTVEIMAFVLIDCLIRRYLHKSISYIFITFTFFMFLAHLADFFIIRLMGMTVWNALDLFLDESLDNFIEMLRASNVSFLSWIFGACLIIAIFSMGVVFFHLTEKWLKRWHLHFSPKLFGAFLCAFPFTLAFFDKLTIENETSSTYESYQKTLPWKVTFFSPKHDVIPFCLHHEKSQQEVKEAINELQTPLAKRPPIFIFVIESLRADFITDEYAPHLTHFKKENISFETAISSANATQVSWFSIFHSKVPLKWAKNYPSHWKMGSPGLYALKELGYKIHTYTSAELAYYQMDELIFGENRFLADSISFFPYGGAIKAHESDTKAITQLCSDIEAHQGEDGHVYITFLDSTHFDYSWPKEMGNRFTPIQEGIDYLNTCYYKGNLELIKNRYRNSVYFVDSLIGKFLSVQNRKDAIIAITGDHGEEYYENGHIFHTSNLSSEQTEVPLYYMLGEDRNSSNLPTITSHIDIFPTILHHLIGNDSQLHFLEGESIFKANKLPYAIAAKYNAGRNPYEFFIHNGKEKMHFKFTNQKSIFDSKTVRLIALKNRFDNEIMAKEKETHEGFLKMLYHMGNNLEH